MKKGNKKNKNTNKKRKNNNKLFLILIILFVVLFAGIFFVLNSNKEITYDENIKINVGDNVPTEVSYKINSDSNSVSVKWDKLSVEDGKIYYSGKYKGVIVINNKEYTVNLIVSDKEKPIIEGVVDLEISKGDSVDLVGGITVKDNSHDDVDIKVMGDYDVDVVGTYNLSYEAKDKSGNTSVSEFKLKVVEKSSSSYKVGKTSKGYDIEVRDGIYYINNILIANKSYTLPDWYAPGLLPELNDAFYKLQNDASASGLNIYIVSGFRSYYDQYYIYNNYVAKDGQALADTYSARAGHSEHQSGLAVDVNVLDIWFEDTEEGKWLKNNCYKYGFIIRYPKGKDDITGYQYEPWHIRYVGKDIATTLYNNGDWITLEEYLGIDSYYH